MTHRQENSNAKEVLSLLRRIWAPHQAPQPGDLAKGLGIPRESDFEGHWGGGGGWWAENLGRHKQNLVCITTQGRGAVSPQETEPDLPVSVWASPAEAWVGSGPPQGERPWEQQSWEMCVNRSPLGGQQQPYHRICRLQYSVASGPTRSECSPSHQQVTGLKFY